MNFTEEDFWISQDNFLTMNSIKNSCHEEVLKFCRSNNLKGKIILPTSGTTSGPKLTLLDKSSMLLSAKSVNEHLCINQNDTWLCCLPTHHVSGLSIYARAYDSSSKVIKLESKWNIADFYNSLKENSITICSLVPAQLYDLVHSEFKPPDDLRALIIGGDHLDAELYTKSINLGWPILRTYGMTESCSQIATEKIVGEGMSILDIWSLNISSDDEILIKGRALFDGYLTFESKNSIKFINPINDDGWFQTGDYGIKENNRLITNGRSDTQIKVLGEKVQLDKIISAISDRYDFDFTIIGIPDERNGMKITMVTDDFSTGKTAVNEYNERSTSIENIKRIIEVDEIPRTELGKLNLKKLQEILEKTKEA